MVTILPFRAYNTDYQLIIDTKYVYLFGKPTIKNELWGISTKTIVYVERSEIDKIKEVWKGTVLPMDICFIDLQKYMTAFEIKNNEHAPIKGEITKVTCNGTEFIYNDGIYVAKGFEPDTEHTIYLNLKKEDGEVIAYNLDVTTNPRKITMEQGYTTQTSLTLDVTASKGDKYCTLGRTGVMINDTYYDEKDYSIKVSGLIPNNSYYIHPYASYNGKIIFGEYSRYWTLGVSPTISGTQNGPTTIKCHGKRKLGDATLKEEYFEYGGHKYEGSPVIINGLKPNSTCEISYTVITNEGSTETVSKKFTTPALELTTLQPKGVSEKCSIVAATTNISEDETNVGFQWKKYDAPESLKPSEGYAAIYDGQIEGYIKNLQPTSYYNVRAFYKSIDGTYYYGSWVTFDPSDFSYFEPTVHTYEATNITDNSAKVKGYVLAGTDDITEQGFEYWSNGTTESQALRVKASVSDEVSTILSAGQVMTATLTNLKAGTTYRFRSFVKTAMGMTYGEEEMFTTDNSTTGIDDVEAAATEPAVIGYYDLNGRKINEAGKGITIIRYSDGTVRKVARR